MTTIVGNRGQLWTSTLSPQLDFPIRAIRFARIDSQRIKTIFEALGQFRANRVFSPILVEIRVICVQSSLLSIFWKVDSRRTGFLKRESIRANPPTKPLTDSTNNVAFVA